MEPSCFENAENVMPRNQYLRTIYSKLDKHLLRIGRAIHRRSSGFSDDFYSDQNCPVCGTNEGLVMHGVLWPDLVLQWRLSPAWANWIDQREGLRCKHCRSNLRSRQLAKSIVSLMNDRIGTEVSSLSDLCTSDAIQEIMVAEINAAGDLHPFLENISGLRYSEYGSANPEIPSEDLLNLSYRDNSFDLILNSDVLEHVPDVEQALREIRRVIKPDGVFIFTVPVVWSQEKTRCRATLQNGKISHVQPPSHHGSAQAEKEDFLVFYEFGRDFVQICEKVGFRIELIADPGNPSLVTFVARTI